MCLRRVALSLILIQVTAKCLAEGLQCYACEDCNEYEDFKELHICGEIPIEVTVKPTTILQATGNDDAATNTTKKSTLMSSSHKPTAQPHIDYYLYEDGAVTLENSEQRNTTRIDAVNTTVAATQSQETFTLTTSKPAITALKIRTESPMKQNSTPTTIITTKTTSQPLVTNIQQISSGMKENATTPSAATATAKPISATDYDDYFDYDDSIKADILSAKALLKINEPVCYMIKYQVNNTILINRGCTTFINHNKYLTCQSLYHGAPMESCRICSSDGCNKFVDGEDDADTQGSFHNAAEVPEYFSVFILVLCVQLSRFMQ